MTTAQHLRDRLAGSFTATDGRRATGLPGLRPLGLAIAPYPYKRATARAAGDFED